MDRVETLKRLGFSRERPPNSVDRAAWSTMWDDGQVRHYAARAIFLATSVMPRCRNDAGEMLAEAWSRGARNVEAVRRMNLVKVADLPWSTPTWYGIRGGRAVTCEKAGEVQALLPGALVNAGPVDADDMVEVHELHMRKFGESFATRLGIADNLEAIVEVLTRRDVQVENKALARLGKVKKPEGPIEEARVAMGMDLQEASRRACLSEATWRNAAKGGEVSRSTALAIREVVGITPECGYDNGEMLRRTWGGTPPRTAMHESSMSTAEVLDVTGLNQRWLEMIRRGTPVPVKVAEAFLLAFPGAVVNCGPVSLAAVRAKLEAADHLMNVSDAAYDNGRRVEGALLAYEALALLPEWLGDMVAEGGIGQCLASCPFWD